MNPKRAQQQAGTTGGQRARCGRCARHPGGWWRTRHQERTDESHPGENLDHLKGAPTNRHGSTKDPKFTAYEVDLALAGGVNQSNVLFGHAGPLCGFRRALRNQTDDLAMAKYPVSTVRPTRVGSARANRHEPRLVLASCPRAGGPETAGRLADLARGSQLPTAILKASLARREQFTLCSA